MSSASCERNDPEWNVSFGDFTGILHVADRPYEFDAESDFTDQLATAITDANSLNSDRISVQLKTELPGLSEFVYFKASKNKAVIDVEIVRYQTPHHGENKSFSDASTAAQWILTKVKDLRSYKNPMNLTD